MDCDKSEELALRFQCWIYTCCSSCCWRFIRALCSGLCSGLPWFSHQDWENICHFPLWLERQVKVLPASLVTWHTWVPPTTVLINRQMEHEPLANWAAVRQHRPCQIVQIADVTSQSASPLCPTATPPLSLSKKKEKKKLTSLIICQTKHYSSWFRSAMLALHSQSISSLSGPKSASLGLIAQPFVPFVCENGKSIWKSSPMSCYHAELGTECCRYEMEIRKTRMSGLIFGSLSPLALKY